MKKDELTVPPKNEPPIRTDDNSIHPLIWVAAVVVVAVIAIGIAPH